VPRALRLLLCLAVLALAAPVASAAPARGGAAAPNDLEREVVQRVNAIRAERGLPSVRVADTLVQAARRHSRAMIAHDEFSHESPGNGESFDRRLRRFHQARVLGETLGWGSGSYGTPAGVVQLWMDSPPHRAILLDRAFARIGVGLARGTFQGVTGASVWTADFASAR
jgi:uncharacterized protein YkwD